MFAINRNNMRNVHEVYSQKTERKFVQCNHYKTKLMGKLKTRSVGEGIIWKNKDYLIMG